jgi:hypothetical protein
VIEAITTGKNHGKGHRKEARKGRLATEDLQRNAARWKEIAGCAPKTRYEEDHKNVGPVILLPQATGLRRIFVVKVTLDENVSRATAEGRAFENIMAGDKSVGVRWRLTTTSTAF